MDLGFPTYYYYVGGVGKNLVVDDRMITGNHPSIQSIHSIRPFVDTRFWSFFFFAFALKRLEEGTFRFCWQGQGKLVNEAREAGLLFACGMTMTGHGQTGHGQTGHDMIESTLTSWFARIMMVITGDR